jgi:hypothetical protein
MAELRIVSLHTADQAGTIQTIGCSLLADFSATLESR